VRWGSALLGHLLKERMTAPDFILDVFRQCVRKGYKVYVLGGKPGVLEDAFKYILKYVPDLNVAGLHHGHFDLVKENERIIKNINEVKPDLLIVGMGFNEH
jgi:N-acetylglucosaminyldiphosphoundecaprenol N-acetyl-beta-D-mannosaminyltransferase